MSVASVLRRNQRRGCRTVPSLTVLEIERENAEGFSGRFRGRCDDDDQRGKSGLDHQLAALRRVRRADRHDQLHERRRNRKQFRICLRRSPGERRHGQPLFYCVDLWHDNYIGSSYTITPVATMAFTNSTFSDVDNRIGWLLTQDQSTPDARAAVQLAIWYTVDNKGFSMSSGDSAHHGRLQCAHQFRRVQAGRQLYGRFLAGDPRSDQHPVPGPGQCPPWRSRTWRRSPSRAVWS